MGSLKMVTLQKGNHVPHTPYKVGHHNQPLKAPLLVILYKPKKKLRAKIEKIFGFKKKSTEEYLHYLGRKSGSQRKLPGKHTHSTVDGSEIRRKNQLIW